MRVLCKGGPLDGQIMDTEMGDIERTIRVIERRRFLRRDEIAPRVESAQYCPVTNKVWIDGAPLPGEVDAFATVHYGTTWEN